MQINLLKDIVVSIAGRSAANIVDILHKSKDVNEFIISKKMKITINQTRTILYDLLEEGLVSFTRKKDKKKGGWYIYYWTLNSGKSLRKFRERLQKRLSDINSEIGNRKSRRFYLCENCSTEYTEENALLNNYSCPECGEVLSLKDTNAEITSLQKEANKISNLLSEIDGEISLIEEKETKTKHRKHLAELRKKKAQRELKKKEREKIAKKTHLKNKRNLK